MKRPDRPPRHHDIKRAAYGVPGDVPLPAYDPTVIEQRKKGKPDELVFRLAHQGTILVRSILGAAEYSRDSGIHRFAREIAFHGLYGSTWHTSVEGAEDVGRKVAKYERLDEFDPLTAPDPPDLAIQTLCDLGETLGLSAKTIAEIAKQDTMQFDADRLERRRGGLGHHLGNNALLVATIPVGDIARDPRIPRIEVQHKVKEACIAAEKEHYSFSEYLGVVPSLMGLANVHGPFYTDFMRTAPPILRAAYEQTADQLPKI